MKKIWAFITCFALWSWTTLPYHQCWLHLHSSQYCRRDILAFLFFLASFGSCCRWGGCGVFGASCSFLFVQGNAPLHHRSVCLRTQLADRWHACWLKHYLFCHPSSADILQAAYVCANTSWWPVSMGLNLRAPAAVLVGCLGQHPEPGAGLRVCRLLHSLMGGKYMLGRGKVCGWGWRQLWRVGTWWKSVCASWGFDAWRWGQPRAQGSMAGRDDGA